jgi:ectoine hydroxylase-related dioxygenase (phytanoyl-CoA dioxygenase family)
MALPDPQITPAHPRRFRDEGWFVIERALAPTQLETLRGECRRLVAERDAEMAHLGVDTLDLCHRGRRYFLHAYATSPAVRQFLFSDLMADVAHAVLGDNVYLFNEQYVIKAAERGLPFGWHQDSAFIPYAHRPYLTCWIPLDDVSESNGTVHLLPYSRAGTHDVVEHQRDHETNDLIGYSGHDPGDPLTVPAGSIAAFSSTLFHRTGPNTSDHPRRVYIAQYTAEPLLSEDRSRPRHLAEPLLTAGHRRTQSAPRNQRPGPADNPAPHAPDAASPLGCYPTTTLPAETGKRPNNAG